jgi:hypothetical protein
VTVSIWIMHRISIKATFDINPTNPLHVNVHAQSWIILELSSITFVGFVKLNLSLFEFFVAVVDVIGVVVVAVSVVVVVVIVVVLHSIFDNFVSTLYFWL